MSIRVVLLKLDNAGQWDKPKTCSPTCVPETNMALVLNFYLWGPGENKLLLFLINLPASLGFLGEWLGMFSEYCLSFMTVFFYFESIGISEIKRDAKKLKSGAFFRVELFSVMKTAEIKKIKCYAVQVNKEGAICDVWEREGHRMWTGPRQESHKYAWNAPLIRF